MWDDFGAQIRPYGAIATSSGAVNFLPPSCRGGPWGVWNGMTTRLDPRYAGYRYPAEIIATAVLLYLRFPLSLRMGEELLAARGITVSCSTVTLAVMATPAGAPFDSLRPVSQRDCGGRKP